MQFEPTDDENDQTEDAIFLTPEKFSEEIHKISRLHRMTLFDSVLFYCHENSIDITDAQKFMDKNLKEKLKRSYESEHLQRKTSDVDIF